MTSTIDIMSAIRSATITGDKFSSTRPRHPNAPPLTDSPPATEELESNQAKNREEERFREKLALHCSKKLSANTWDRERAIKYFRYYEAHFGHYVQVIEMVPNYKGARGKDVAHIYMRKVEVCPTLMLSDVVTENLVADREALPCLRRDPKLPVGTTLGPEMGNWKPTPLNELRGGILRNVECACSLCDLKPPKLRGPYRSGPGIARARSHDDVFLKPLTSPPKRA